MTRDRDRKSDAHGNSILTLREKLDALRHCMENGQDEYAIGHLFDLLHHIAPAWKFLGFRNLQEIADHYGADPEPIE